MAQLWGHRRGEEEKRPSMSQGGSGQPILSTI